MTPWEQWVREVTGGAPSRTVAEVIGKSHSTAQTWMSRPTPQSAILLAVAYRADPIEALRVGGFLTMGDLDTGAPDPELQAIPSVRLTAELYRRAREAERERGDTKHDPFEGLRPPVS